MSRLWGNYQMPAWKNVRDVVLFFSGLAGVFYETVISVSERPTLLLMFAAMMGLPAFLRTDEKPPPREEGLEMMRQSIEDEKSRGPRG